MMERNGNIEYVAEQALWLVKEVPTSGTERNKLQTKTGSNLKPVDQEEWDQLDFDYSAIMEELVMAEAPIGEAFDVLCREIAARPAMRRNKLKEDRLAILSLRLSATKTGSLPGASVKEGGWSIPHSNTVLMWLSSITVLGGGEPEEPPTCFAGEMYPITEQGQRISANNITDKIEVEFSEDMILQEGDEGAHDICQWATKI